MVGSKERMETEGRATAKPFVFFPKQKAVHPHPRHDESTRTPTLNPLPACLSPPPLPRQPTTTTRRTGVQLIARPPALDTSVLDQFIQELHKHEGNGSGECTRQTGCGAGARQFRHPSTRGMLPASPPSAHNQAHQRSTCSQSDCSLLHGMMRGGGERGCARVCCPLEAQWWDGMTASDRIHRFQPYALPSPCTTTCMLPDFPNIPPTPKA